MNLNDPFPTLFLASNSPRRKQLLSLVGWKFQTFPTQLDETPVTNELPAAYVIRLATDKAKTVFARVRRRNLTSNDTIYILAADTTVVDGYDILGKPTDDANAIAMLSRLRARLHQVYSGVAVIRLKKTGSYPKDANQDFSLLNDVCTTDVVMRNYNDDDIVNYVASGDPLDKAGGYAIQHSQFRPVECIKGCYLNVMGLPLCHLTRQLRELDAETGTNHYRILECCRHVAVDGLLREDCCQQIWEQFGWL